VQRTVQAAACVLTPSEFSKRAILNAYKLSEDKVVVLPNGVSSVFRPVAREVAQRSLRIPLPRAPFILTVGDLQPRKNHLGLIRAFEELIRAHPQLPHHLSIVGKEETWYAPTVRAAAKKSPLADRIHFTGFVDDEELRRLYGLWPRDGLFQHIGHAGSGRFRGAALRSLFAAGSGFCHARSVVESGIAPAHGTAGGATGGDVQLGQQRR